MGVGIVILLVKLGLTTDVGHYELEKNDVRGFNRVEMDASTKLYRRDAVKGSRDGGRKRE